MVPDGFCYAVNQFELEQGLTVEICHIEVLIPRRVGIDDGYNPRLSGYGHLCASLLGFTNQHTQDLTN